MHQSKRLAVCIADSKRTPDDKVTHSIGSIPVETTIEKGTCVTIGKEATTTERFG